MSRSQEHILTLERYAYALSEIQDLRAERDEARDECRLLRAGMVESTRRLSAAVALLRRFTVVSHHVYSPGHCVRCDAQDFLSTYDKDGAR